MTGVPRALHELDERCTAALAEHGCPSVSVAVAEEGEVVLAEAYGWANVAARLPATPRTAYALASVTKPVTATAVCVAADEGLLDLETPVQTVGEHGPAGGEHAGWGLPTVRQLLMHRGGLGAHYDFHYGGGRSRLDADRYAVLYRRPGSGFEYSNLGYRLLGRALESAAGRSLEEYVRDRVFEPLGLTGCRLGPSYPVPDASAVRYTADGRPYPAVCGSSHPGASLGWGTAPELALFAQSRDSLLRPETAAATLDALPVTPHLGYGLGWCVSSGDGPVLLSHGGGMGGVAAMTVAVPDQRLSVAVLSNSTGKAARDAVVRYVLGELVPGFRVEQITPARPVAHTPVGLPQGTWAGSIRTPEGEVPATLRVLADSRTELRLEHDGALGFASASEDRDLRVLLPLQLPTADARINSPMLGLELRARSGGLSGVARACGNGERGVNRQGWLSNLLSHPCELTPR